MRRLLLRILPLLFLLPALSASAAEVLASIRPLALIATAVMGERGTLNQLVPDGVSSHDYSMRPSDRIGLAHARVVLWIGPAHETFLVKALAASPAEVITAQNLPGITRLAQRDLNDGHALPHTFDAHLWLAPTNAAVIARALAEALGKREPGNASYYRANAAAFAARMQALEARLGQALPPGPRRYLAYHDAYQYLELPLGLSFAGAVTLGHEQAPGAKHLAQLAQRIRQEKIACLLAEPGFDPALAQRPFDGTPARFVAVDELFTKAPRSPQGYEQGLLGMVDGLRACLNP